MLSNLPSGVQTDVREIATPAESACLRNQYEDEEFETSWGREMRFHPFLTHTEPYHEVNSVLYPDVSVTFWQTVLSVSYTQQSSPVHSIGGGGSVEHMQVA